MDTTHDPIQRFSAYHSGDPHKVGLWADGDGHWVTYANHVAAVAAVRAERQAEFTRMENAWRDECDRRERAAWDSGDRNVAKARAAAVDEAIRRVEEVRDEHRDAERHEWDVMGHWAGGDAPAPYDGPPSLRSPEQALTVVLAALAGMKEA